MADYVVYTDKEGLFECSVDVKGASTKNAIARLIFENTKMNVMFNGEIKDNKCTIPLTKFKDILDENSKGEVRLEIIVEDTYFTPWKSQYLVDVAKTVTAEVKPSITESKKVSVTVVTPKEVPIKVEINHSNVLKEQIVGKGINKKNIKTHVTKLKQIVESYFNDKYPTVDAQEKKNIIRDTLLLIKKS